MKKIIKPIILLILGTIITSLLIIPSLASQGAGGINYDQGRSSIAELNRLCEEHYMKKANGTVANAAGNTCTVIIDYRTDIERLMYSEASQTTDFTEEIKLLERKGSAAGILSWIFYSHPETASVSEVKECYERQMDAIDKKTVSDIGFFTANEGKAPEVEKCYTLLLQSVYSAKIRALSESDDSETVRAMLLAYPSTMGSACRYDSVNSDGEDGSNYENFFEGVILSIEKQRNKDRTAEELCTVFSLLFPDEDFSSSARLADFNTALKTQNTIIEMNELLADTIIDLIDDLYIEGKYYRNEYLSNKKNDVSVALDVSNNKDTVSLMPISLWFSKYTTEIRGADAKDELTEYSKDIADNGKYSEANRNRINGIVEEYVSVGRIFDSSPSVFGIDQELDRAKTRCVWLDLYIGASSKISSYSGEHSSLLSAALEQYELTDRSITLGERDGSGDPLIRLNADLLLLNTLAARSEAIGFRANHSAALSLSSATSDHLSLLSSALKDAHLLSTEAKSILNDSLISLGERYKEASVLSVTQTLSSGKDDELNKYCSDTLSQYIDRASVKDSNGVFNIYTFMQSIDTLVAKADTLRKICAIFQDEYLTESGRYFYDNAVSAVKASAERAPLLGSQELLSKASAEIRRAAALERIFFSAEGYDTLGDIPTILENAKADIVNYYEKSDIEAYASTTVTRIVKIIRDKIVSDATVEIKTLKNKIYLDISGYSYISDEARASFTDKLNSAYDTALNDLASAISVSEAEKAANDGKLAMNNVSDESLDAELQACRKFIDASILDAYGSTENYSQKNQEKLTELLSEYKSALDAATDVSELEKLLTEAVSKIKDIENKLDEALRVSKDSLSKEFSRLAEKKAFYGSDRFSELENIYSRTLTELNALVSLDDAQKAYDLANERIALMKSIRLDMLYTSDEYLLDGNKEELPEGYDPESNGYIGSIHSSGGISSDMTLSIIKTDIGEIKDVIVKAAKDKLVSLHNGDSASRKLLKALKKCNVVAAVDIQTGTETSLSDKIYKVTILLPSTLDTSDILGVVFVRNDGSVEFFEASAGSSVLEFETTHFSKYYVIEKGTVDLLPVIICLILIILCEIAIIVLLLIRRKKPAPAENENLSAFIAPFALSVNYRPAGGRAIVALLGTIAISLAAYLAYLVYLEMRDNKKRMAIKSRNAESMLVPVPTGGFDKPIDNAESSETVVPTMEETKVSPHTEPLSSISADEAEAMMSDISAEDLYSNDYEDLEIYHGDKKSQINIDTISVFFKDGDTVTLNSLKEKGLVPKSTGCVKILARGVLDKQLTIVAQDFSSSAVKMIHLMGGKAVITHQSSERNQRKK